MGALRHLLRLIVPVLLPASSALAGPIPAPTLEWERGGCFTSWCQTGWYSSPAVADLDGDGAPEVLWGSYDLTAIDGEDGTLQWRASNAQRVWPGVAVADLSGDGTLEIIVGRGGDQLTVYDTSGDVVWARNPFGFGEVRTLAVADLDGDGPLEVIVGRTGSGNDQQLRVYEADGAARSGWPAPEPGDDGYGAGLYNQNVAIRDFDGDGEAEIIGPTDTHYITALDRLGNQLPVDPIYVGRYVWREVGVHVDHLVDVRGYAFCGVEHRPNWAHSAPITSDLDGDRTFEIVVVGNVYDCDTNPYTSLYHMAFALEIDRTRWTGSGHDWTAIPAPEPNAAPLSEDYTLIENAQPNVVAADLDGDGEKEILFPSYDGRLHAYWLDKTQHGSWPYAVPGEGIRFASEPAVVDIDGDGAAEVIFASWPQKGGNRIGQLHMLDAMGNPLHAVSLPAPHGGATWNGGLAAPTVANIDGDASLEVVVGTSSSGAVAYELPGSADARVLWGTGRGSYLRAGKVEDTVIMSDGFESGDTGAWSQVVP
jgi:hypothetical protein